MVLILGGTTEGRIAIQALEEAGTPFYYSTRGSEQDVSLHNGIRLQGGMDTTSMEAFCRAHHILLMVDAAHPFAEELHRTVATVSGKVGIPVVRLERIYPRYEEADMVWCADFNDAIRRLQSDGIASLLCLTGVQTIGRLRPLWAGWAQDSVADTSNHGPNESKRPGDNVSNRDDNNPNQYKASKQANTRYASGPKPSCRCHFRILDRDRSRALARQEGFPEECLHYYRQGEDERRLMSSLRPDAILTKESGLSGGMREKVEAAHELGIRIYAIRRPALPSSFHTVDGPHGLRRMVERLLPDFYPLHSGLTTGTCATAAAVAATRSLMETMGLSTYFPAQSTPIPATLSSNESAHRDVGCPSSPAPVQVTLPNGETIQVDVESQPSPTLTRHADGSRTISAQAAVVKDAGDDPDITNGMTVCAKVTISLSPESEVDMASPTQRGKGSKANDGPSKRVDRDHRGELELPTVPPNGPTQGDNAKAQAVQEPLNEPTNESKAACSSYSIAITGGPGIGTVTLPGLGLPVGGPAINETPRHMIEENVGSVLRNNHAPSGRYEVCISVPGGETVAQRTFNPRIGVVGGISIIGTSGIVKPFSAEAFVSSIRKSMAVAKATGADRVVINSGAMSERYLHDCYPDLPLQAFVHYGNFIGETLQIAAELGIAHLTMGLMIGKAVKLAEGQMDTHSKHSTMNRAFIQALAREAGCSTQTQESIMSIGLARELWTLLPAAEIPAFCHVLTAHCYRHCAPLLPQGELTILLITDAGQVISPEPST